MCAIVEGSPGVGQLALAALDLGHFALVLEVVLNVHPHEHLVAVRTLALLLWAVQLEMLLEPLLRKLLLPATLVWAEAIPALAFVL